MSYDGLNMWNNWSKSRKGKPVYDKWLDEYEDVLKENKENVIVDLGAGIGANTLYLMERGYRVLSCDYAIEALMNIHDHIKDSYIQHLDMRSPFPFDDQSLSVMIADISLHYFDDSITLRIMKEIKRVLKEDGVLLARVSRYDDMSYHGEQIEENYYDMGSYAQRYFTVHDIKKHFGIIGSISYQETTMVRDEPFYSYPKYLYQIKVKKG